MSTVLFQQAPTRKSIDAFLADLPEGTVMVCTENGYKPANVGLTVTVERTASSKVYAYLPNNDRVVLNLPHSVGGFVSVGQDSITYLLNGPNRVTWEVSS